VGGKAVATSVSHRSAVDDVTIDGARVHGSGINEPQVDLPVDGSGDDLAGAVTSTAPSTVSADIGARTPSTFRLVCTPARLRPIQGGALIRSSIPDGRPWVRTLTAVAEVEISTRSRSEAVASTRTASRFQARTVTSPP
jgi:hypothetical protein